MINKGVLPIQRLGRLRDEGYITGVAESFLNPASIDLPLSGEAYRIDRSFLPRAHQTVRDWLKLQEAVRHDLKQPLAVGATYLVRIEGEWALPDGVYGYANPKSSTGRIGLLCWTVADSVGMYDTLSPGWYGEQWMLIRSDYFRVRLREGLAIAQVRLFDGSSFLSTREMKNEILRNGLLFSPDGRKLGFSEIDMHRDSLFLTLAIGADMGYVSRMRPKAVLDYGSVGTHDISDFFESVSARGDVFNLDRERLYILSTAERVMVAPPFSAELRAIDVRLGDYKSHAAGYIDAGWGWGSNGEAHGRPITLEIISYQNSSVQRGQRIARLRYERMAEVPAVAYDAAGSNYVVQTGAKLSKHFKS